METQRLFDNLIRARHDLIKVRKTAIDVPTEATYNHAIYGIAQVLKMMKTQNPFLQGPSEEDIDAR